MNGTTVNGILLTNELQAVLIQWQEPTSSFAKSTPELYVEYLNDIQDCLTRFMMLESYELKSPIVDLLEKLLCVKDDLKLFILEKGVNQ